MVQLRAAAWAGASMVRDLLQLQRYSGEVEGSGIPKESHCGYWGGTPGDTMGMLARLAAGGGFRHKSNMLTRYPTHHEAC